VLNYVIGRAPSSDVPHFTELAPVFSGMCEQSVVCHTNDTLDLVIALTAYAQTAEGRVSLDRMEALVNHPALQPYIVDDGNTYGGEEGLVSLTRLVLRTVQSMDDPSDLNALPTSSFPESMRAQLELALSDMKSLLSATRSPNVLKPLQKVSTCLTLKDSRMETVRMAYRLGLEKQLPEFGIHNIVHVIKGLRDADSRGSLLRLGQLFAEAVRADDQAVNAAATVCRSMFSLQPEPGQLKTNVELALPVVADLFRDGVIAEGVCAADTLLYGCAGGTQPACKPITTR
jgi:hypothetical protein